MLVVLCFRPIAVITSESGERKDMRKVSVSLASKESAPTVSSAVPFAFARKLNGEQRTREKVFVRLAAPDRQRVGSFCAIAVVVRTKRYTRRKTKDSEKKRKPATQSLRKPCTTTT